VQEETKDLVTFEEQVMAEDDQEMDVDIIADEDKNMQNHSFKQWLANLHAQNSMLHIVLKLADFIENSQDSDEEFEDCTAEQDEGTVIDLD